jgi:hypothetical protein
LFSALAVLAATESSHEVDRSADPCAAELERDRAPIQLDLAECIE